MASNTSILLTAANGRTGRAVLKAMVIAGLDVRVFIRDESQFDELKALGAQDYVVGDMLNASDFDKATSGVDKVIHIGPPMHPKEVEITSSLIQAAKSNGVNHFIYYSVMHPLRRVVRHHRLKLDVEEHIIESGLPYTILQPTRYMQHLLPIWSAVVETGIHSMAFGVDKKFNVVDLEDLAEACAVVAKSNDHLYATYELAGPEALSQNDMAAIISDVISKSVTAKMTDLDALKDKAKARGFNEDKIEQMLIMNKHYDEHGFLGNSNILEYLLGRPAARYVDYVKRLAVSQ